jgi:hypothetical protein
VKNYRVGSVIIVELSFLGIIGNCIVINVFKRRKKKMISEKVKKAFNDAKDSVLEVPKIENPSVLQSIIYCGLMDARYKDSKNLLEILDETCDWIDDAFYVSETSLFKKELEEK